jgi:hypothetical protein
MTTHLQQTMDDLVAQRARIDAAITALQELGAAAMPSENGTRAPRVARRSPAKAPKARKVDGRRSTRDWVQGRRLYDAGKSFQEIADALHTSVGTIYDARSRFNWPKRSGKKKRPEGQGAGRVTPAAPRARLAHPAICPTCGAQTSVDPCGYCHTYLPKALGGKRTFAEVEG